MKGHCGIIGPLWHLDAKATPLCIKEGARVLSVHGKFVQQGRVLNALSRKGQKASALIHEKRKRTYDCEQGRKSKEGQFWEKSFNRGGLKGVSWKVPGQVTHVLLSPGRRGCRGENRANHSSAGDVCQSSFNGFLKNPQSG